MHILPLYVLEAKDACKEDMEVVRQEWPNGIPVTEETAVRVVELELDLDWAIENLLSFEEYKSYMQAKRPVQQDYINARDSIRILYNQAGSPVNFKEFDEALAPARKIYRQAKAKIFLQLLQNRNIRKNGMNTLDRLCNLLDALGDNQGQNCRLSGLAVHGLLGLIESLHGPAARNHVGAMFQFVPVFNCYHCNNERAGAALRDYLTSQTEGKQ